jgi:hypothetical protein
MSNNFASALGRLLILKGEITKDQLLDALDVQSQQQVAPSTELATQSTNTPKQKLGEVLVEKGYLSSDRLDYFLKLQRQLRNASIIATLSTPLFTFSHTTYANDDFLELPAKIEAENFSSMLGFETEKTSDLGGGFNVSYLHEGDWASYENIPVHVPTTGQYKIVFRVASLGGTAQFSLTSADRSVTHATFDVVRSGGNQKFMDTSQVVELTEGFHEFGISVLSRKNAFNINWFSIEAAEIPPVEEPIYQCTPSGQNESTYRLSWSLPENRNNFDPLSIADIAGYEIRYRKEGGKEASSIILRDAYTDTISLNLPNSSYEFQIATFDRQGLYSKFVAAVAN